MANDRVIRDAADSLGLLAAFSHDVQRISGLVSSEIRLMIERTDDTKWDQPRAVAYGQLLRMDAWMRSLCKLNEPLDFQPIAAGARSLLELSVDLALVATQPSAAQEMIDWEWSAKHKHAAAVKRYYDERKLPVPSENREAALFAVRDATRIDALRRRNRWIDQKQRPIHPPRWTRRNLDADCVEADKWPHRSDFSFVRFYETRFRPLCWEVHGSGFVGRSTGADVFPFVAARGLLEAADLTIVGSKACLHIFGLWSSQMTRSFDELENQRRSQKDEHFVQARLAAQQGPAADGAAPRR